MGGAVSAGADNDELIDNLLEADYIKSNAVERVFRAVDRGHYFTIDYKERAYRDTAWKFGNLHISAPCIYSRVMENLKLGPGMSFLNLGSGTGYLSTMAGLILGSNGINHGIEIHEDVINYATKKLEEFILTSSAIDEYEFCPPKFVCGNCLSLGNGCRQYDRVYCGAACPENHESYMKNLIKVGGILVMPINDQLLQIHRTSDTNWESKSVLPVSFATLISGKYNDCGEPLKTPDEEPLSLQDICRYVVRSILRRNIDLEHPELKKPTRIPKKKVKKKNFRKLVIFNSNSDGEEDPDPLQPSTLRNSRGFVMDVDNVETCGSLIEWQILQDPTTASAEVFESISSPETNTHNNSASDAETKNDSDSRVQTDTSSETIFEEGSDDEFLSDFEELHSMLAGADRSTTVAAVAAIAPRPTSEVVERKEADDNSSSSKAKDKQEGVSTKEKSKREKVDSGIVEDIDTGKEVNLDSEDEEVHTPGHMAPNSQSQESESKVEEEEMEESDENSDTEEKESDENSQSEEKESDENSQTEEKESDENSQMEEKENVENLQTEEKENGENTQMDIVKEKESTSTPSPEASAAPVINYSTYMREKIKMLPLPMTLKYFLNLNREL